MTNTELLTFNNSALLTTIESQKRFVLTQHVQQKPCPNCATRSNVFEAGRIEIDAYTFDGPEGQFFCPACKRELVYILPMMGSWRWGLVPVKVAPDEAK